MFLPLKLLCGRRPCVPVCGACAGQLWGLQALAFGRRVGGSRQVWRKEAHSSLCVPECSWGRFLPRACIL